MKLTYEEIVSQVASQLGDKGFGSNLKANYRYAIRFAEQEILAFSGIAKREETINLTTTKTEYELPFDYNEPCEFIFRDTVGGQLKSVNIPKAELMAIKNEEQEDTVSSSEDILYDQQTIENLQTEAKYNKILVYSIDFTDGFYRLSVKPPIDGSVEIYYSAIAIDDVFANLKRNPILPEHFHVKIINGAVAYLARGRASEAQQGGNIQAMQYFNSLAKQAKEDFKLDKIQVAAKSDEQAHPNVIKSFVWFDNPLKYR